MLPPSRYEGGAEEQSREKFRGGGKRIRRMKRARRSPEVPLNQLKFKDLVQHATDWRLMSSSSIAGFQKAERQAMVYGMETATITAAAATLPNPQSVPADATIQVRRAARGA